MKLFLPLWATLVGLALVSADRSYRPEQDAKNGTTKGKIKTAVDFGNDGGAIAVYLGANATTNQNQTVVMKVSRLEEYDSTGKVVQRAENFHKIAATWTPITTVSVNNVSTMATSLITDLPVGPNGKAGTVPFNLTANIYQGAGAAMNGNQTIPVQAGALKFSVTIGKWPFMNINNSLVFSVTLAARGKGGRSMDAPPQKGKSNTTAHMDRLQFGEGIFMDAPNLAVADGKTVNISSTLNISNVVEFVWTLPYFNQTMYYDPVLGSTDPSAVTATDSGSSMGTPTPTPTPSPTSAGVLMSGSTAVLALAVIASFASAM